jgi:hypothetical protein
MTESSQLERECHVFTRLLTGEDATAGIIAKYRDAHAVLEGCVPVSAIDRRLTGVARAGAPLARMADAYARLFAPNSAFRRKLVLLLAILETSPPFHARIDRTEPRGLVTTLGRLALAGVLGVLAALAGMLLFGPMHVWARLAGRRA